jgi:PII-like signaling protein
MKLIDGEQTLLRVYLRNTDSYHWLSAADALAERAKHEGLAGVTVLRGKYGLDFNGKLLDSHPWSLTEHLPVIVEFVDTAANIGRFLTTAVAEVLPEGMVTLERAHVMVYRRRDASEKASLPLLPPEPISDLSTVPRAEEFPIMEQAEDGQLLRIFVGESDLSHGEPLPRVIVLKARELGLSGATVLHGSMGFGAHSRVHTERLLELSTNLPVVIEIVDTADKLKELLPFLDEVVQEGLITIESVRVLKYRRHQPG